MDLTLSSHASNDIVPLAGPPVRAVDRENRLRFSWFRRFVLGASGLTLMALLAIAAWLEPDPRQYGTHQQLGLPACTIDVLYGIRCPSCGMTTSWAWMMDGRPAKSWQANAGGALLALVSILAAPWLLASAAAGRWIGGPLNEWFVVFVSLAIVTVTLVEWSWRVWS